MGDALGLLGQLRPVSFDWKDSVNYTAMNGGKSDFGLIAQEVNNVIPTLVAHDDDGTITGVNYAGFVPFIIKGVQQQQGQIAALQNATNALSTSVEGNTTSISQQQTQINGIQNTLGTINGQLAAGSFTNLSTGGNLSVTGAANIGSLTVTGSTTLNGTLFARSAEFVGTLTINGHLVAKGKVPQITIGSALGSGDAVNNTGMPTASVQGTDGSGNVSLTAGTQQLVPGLLAHITFASSFSTSYNAVLSASNDHAADLRIYIVKSNDGFDIMTRDPLQSGTNYDFDYIVVGAQQVASN